MVQISTPWGDPLPENPPREALFCQITLTFCWKYVKAKTT